MVMSAFTPSVLLVHNRYQQAGGEDEVFAAEHALLAMRGHDVTTFVADNRSIGGARRLSVAGATVWNPRRYRELRRASARRAPPPAVTRSADGMTPRSLVPHTIFKIESAISPEPQGRTSPR